MDLYVTSLLLGVVGLGAMAVSGLGSHGHAGHPSHGSGNGATGSHSLGHGQPHGHSAASHGAHGHAPGGASRALWAFMSPRFLFSLVLGFGTVGELLRPVLGGPFLFAAAVVGAVAFERLIVSPLWNFTMRFASKPATTLESAIAGEATAVTAFDANGQGIVSIEVDGQIVQILATLQSNDRLLGGARIRAGQRVRIDEVNAEKNCCTVSIL